MKIIRVQNENGEIIFGSLLNDGSANYIEGDIFEKFSVTDQKISIKKSLYLSASKLRF